jgi:hypothetical protein
MRAPRLSRRCCRWWSRGRSAHWRGLRGSAMTLSAEASASTAAAPAASLRASTWRRGAVETVAPGSRIDDGRVIGAERPAS